MTAGERPQPAPVDAERAAYLSKGLELAFAGRTDFERALRLINSNYPDDPIGDDNRPAAAAPDDTLYWHALGSVGESMGLAGLEVTLPLRWLGKFRDDKSSLMGILHEQIARVHLASGNLASFEESLSKTIEEPDSRHDYVKIAQIKTRLGQVPRAELEKERLAIVRNERKYGSAGHSKEWTKLAQVYFEATGEYPAPYFAEAEASIQAYAKKYPGDTHLPNLHEEAAEAYAVAGNFEAALSHVEQIKGGYDPISDALARQRSQTTIVKELLARDHFEQAMSVAQQAIRDVDGAVAKPEHLKGHLDHAQGYGAATLEMLTARAQRKQGLDPTPALTNAMKRTRVDVMGAFEMEILLGIVEGHAEFGMDPKPTLQYIESCLEALPKRADFDFYDALELANATQIWPRLKQNWD